MIYTLSELKLLYESNTEIIFISDLQGKLGNWKIKKRLELCAGIVRVMFNKGIIFSS